MAGEDVADDVARHLNDDMQRRITDLQRADRRYWREIIADLKRLRAADKLISEGAEV